MQEANAAVRKKMSDVKLADRQMKNFLSKILLGYGGKCWPWTGALNSTGYGAFVLGRKIHTAHRASFMLFNGEIPDGMEVCHTCDVRHCVNPEHLFLGSRMDNVRDCISKGRHSHGWRHKEILRRVSAKGAKHGSKTQPQTVRRGSQRAFSKLKEEDVFLIKALAKKMTQKQVASMFGVSQTLISSICRGILWTHVPTP